MKTTIPVTRTTIETDKVFCDLCKKDITGKKIFQVDDVTISCSYGTYFPEGGGGAKTLEYDLCVQCFLVKLIPWMKSQGAEEPREREWE